MYLSKFVPIKFIYDYSNEHIERLKLVRPCWFTKNREPYALWRVFELVKNLDILTNTDTARNLFILADRKVQGLLSIIPNIKMGIILIKR